MVDAAAAADRAGRAGRAAAVAAHRDPGHRGLPAARACRWPGCWPAAACPAGGCVRALVTVPLVLPPVVGGVALLLVLGRRGLVGAWLDATFGFTLPFTTAGRGGGRGVRGDAVPGDQRRGRAARRRRPVRGGRRHARREPLDRVPPGHPAADRARASRPARCSAGPGRWASSARRSPSPATSRAVRRPCRWPSTWRWRQDLDAAIVLSLVLLVVSVVILAALRDRWLGARHEPATRTWSCDRPGFTLDLDLTRRARRGGRAARPERRRQDHRAARAGRADPAGRRPHHAGRPDRLRRAVAPGAPAGSAWSSRTTCSSRTCRALDNVAFGPRCRGVPQGRRPGDRPRDWLDRVGLAEHARQAAPAALRRPGAAGRAGPRAGHRARGCCCSTSRSPRWTPAPGWTPAPTCAATSPTHPGATVLVTHDPLDAMMLADRLVIVEDGRVVQTGDAGRDHHPAAHRLRRPAGRAQPLSRPGRRPRRAARPTTSP